MAATARSSRSVLRPLSSSQTLHHHRQRSPSPCNNRNLRLKLFSPGNVPKPSVAVSNQQKRKCLCSPTSHPGSFRCAFHRRLEQEKSKTLGSSTTKRDNRGGKTMRINVGVDLRKLALNNSLAKIASVEAERFRRSLAANLAKPSSLLVRPRCHFRPRHSRFYELRTDQD